MRVDSLYPAQRQVAALVEAVWQCLDDMGTNRGSVCGLAHAQLRIAYEPFKDPDVDSYDDWLTLDAARKIVSEAR